MRWAGHVTRMGEERKLYKVLVRNPEGKRPLVRPRRRWNDGIRMDLRETDLRGVDWIRLAQDRDRWRAVVSAVMNLRALAPQSSLVSYLRLIKCIHQCCLPLFCCPHTDILLLGCYSKQVYRILYIVLVFSLTFALIG
jgi:hypothetical protein